MLAVCKKYTFDILISVRIKIDLPRTNSCCNVTSICICHKEWRCYGDLKLEQNCITKTYMFIVTQ